MALLMLTRSAAADRSSTRLGSACSTQRRHLAGTLRTPAHGRGLVLVIHVLLWCVFACELRCPDVTVTGDCARRFRGKNDGVAHACAEVSLSSVPCARSDVRRCYAAGSRRGRCCARSLLCCARRGCAELRHAAAVRCARSARASRSGGAGGAGRRTERRCTAVRSIQPGRSIHRQGTYPAHAAYPAACRGGTCAGWRCERLSLVCSSAFASLALPRRSLNQPLPAVHFVKAPWAATASVSIFLVASLTDWLDGYLARKVSQWATARALHSQPLPTAR